MNFNKKLLILIFLLTIVISVGTVSAEENIVSNETQEITLSDYVLIENTDTISNVNAVDFYVNNNTSLSQINGNISAASAANGGNVYFAPGNYNNIALVLKNNVNLIGNGANLYGDGSNYVIDVSNTINTKIIGFNIFINSNSSNGISGYEVTNCLIKNNTIRNGGDAINIFRFYTNVTIEKNTIINMTGRWGDGISLVNHNQNFDIDNWVGSKIIDNVIENVIYGIFLGGNFKGNISGNNITNANEGMHFQGKRAATNGKLKADIVNNRLINVNTGIQMDHPNVMSLNIYYNNIICNDIFNGYSINTNNYFNKTGSIHVHNCLLDGLVSTRFQSLTNSTGNNTGEGAY